MTNISDAVASPADLQTLLRTFLIADVRGYTSFTVEHGSKAGAALAMKFATLAKEVVSCRDGDVIELRGDEALAVYPRRTSIGLDNAQRSTRK